MIKIISGILVGIGMFFLVVDFLRIPYAKTRKAMVPNYIKLTSGGELHHIY